MNNKVLFTGGHHNSSIPLIKRFLENGYKVTFVGHKFASKSNKKVSSEYKEIKNLNIKYINLNAPKFYKIKGITKYFRLLNSFIKSFIILIKYRPKLIISYGGYLGVPIGLAGKLLNIPLVIHEQTNSFGMANSILEKISNKVYLTWPNENLNQPKYELVGLPLRSEIKNVSKKKLNKNYKIQNIFFQGGKQGSHIINSFVFENLEELLKDYKVYHQTSRHSENNDYEKSQKIGKELKNYIPFDYKFGSDYTRILDKTDLIISRSGAHIVYEMCYLKIPSIFIPIPWSSRNEQLLNAKKSKKFIPSVILDQKILSYASLKNSIMDLNKTIKSMKQYESLIDNSELRMYKSIKKHFF